MIPIKEVEQLHRILIDKFGGSHGIRDNAALESALARPVVLPNTQITISIPTTKYILAVKKDKYSDRGIIPDYTIIPNINEIIKNKDVKLNFAFKLAAEK